MDNEEITATREAGLAMLAQLKKLARPVPRAEKEAHVKEIVVALEDAGLVPEFGCDETLEENRVVALFLKLRELAPAPRATKKHPRWASAVSTRAARRIRMARPVVPITTQEHPTGLRGVDCAKSVVAGARCAFAYVEKAVSGAR